jgi:hypothetical protein
MNATLFQYFGDPNDYLEAERQLQAQSLPQDLTMLPSFKSNGQQLQIYVQDNFINTLLRTFFNAKLMKYTLKSIDTETLVNDYYLKIFLVNDIDTDFIQVFIPEIYRSNSNFVSYDENGRIKSRPCEVSF